jgi:hypothetical protein
MLTSAVAFNVIVHTIRNFGCLVKCLSEFKHIVGYGVAHCAKLIMIYDLSRCNGRCWPQSMG